ncbi:hypothetical protein HZA85_00790 [Candidatus Uhrbacteria bacterium]|nr:hypothetical protein [Candidatus Uhrbacteria bacterium]
MIHAIAYTNVFIKWPASATPATPAAPATSTPAAATPATPATPAKTETKILSIQQQAVGWFGKLTGKLPSSDADWKAVNYMVSGYKPVKQDVDAESEAIALFSQKFGHLPSSNQDWNIIAAIAYSGAF